jgi:hypothetical protein
MDPTYEQLVLRKVQQQLRLFPPGSIGGKSIIVEDISLEKGEAEGEDIVILFRTARHPHCLFGFRMAARELGEWEGNTDPEELVPTAQGMVIYANFKEQIEASDMGLPEECHPDGITWI